MITIGCDYHPGFQQIAYVDTESGELQERTLQHREEAEKFYRDNQTDILFGPYSSSLTMAVAGTAEESRTGIQTGHNALLIRWQGGRKVVLLS